MTWDFFIKFYNQNVILAQINRFSRIMRINLNKINNTIVFGFILMIITINSEGERMNILRVEASLKWMVKKNKCAGCGRVQLLAATALIPG